MFALSIRQPWPWFILCGFAWAKDVENRDWPLPRDYLGHNCLIHAGKAMTQREFDEACQFAAEAGATMFPKFDELKRGGIVGMVKFTKCVRLSSSPWFSGKFGFVISEPYPLPFRRCQGQLGFFKPVFLV